MSVVNVESSVKIPPDSESYVYQISEAGATAESMRTTESPNLLLADRYKVTDSSGPVHVETSEEVVATVEPEVEVASNPLPILPIKVTWLDYLSLRPLMKKFYSGFSAFGYNRSLFIFGPKNPVRVAARSVTAHAYFETGVMLAIGINCIVLAMADPTQAVDSTWNTNLQYVELALLVVFTIEAVLNIVSNGLLFSPNAYLLNPWNQLDCFVVLTAWLEYVPGMVGLSSLRALRCLRPLRSIDSVPGIKVLVTTLLESIPLLADVFLLLSWLFITFGILGAQLFSGRLYGRCRVDMQTEMYDAIGPEIGHSRYKLDVRVESDYNYKSVSSQHCDFKSNQGYDCNSEYYNQGDGNCEDTGENPGRGFLSYDHFGWSWLSIFQVLTLSNWDSSMFYTVDAVGGTVAIPFYLGLVTFGVYFSMQLLVAVISTKFDQIADEEDNLSPEQAVATRLAELEEIQRLNSGAEEDPEKSVLWYQKYTAYILLKQYVGTPILMVWGYSPPWKPYFKKVCDNPYFVNFILFLTVLNTISMAMEHHGMSEMLRAILDVSNLIFTLSFLVEMVLKLFGEGFIRYWLDTLNAVDGFVNIMSLVELCAAGGANMSALRMFRLIRIVRSMRILRSSQKFMQMVRSIIRAFAALRDFSCLLALFLFMFIVLGMQMFGGRELQGYGSRRTFDNFFKGFLTMFEMLTGNDWDFTMRLYMETSSELAAVFFVAVIIVGNYVVLNLFLAILINNINLNAVDEDEKEQLQAACNSLSKSWLFQDCRLCHLQELANKLSEQHYKKGAKLFHYGTDCDCMYFLVSGKCMVEGQVSSEGNQGPLLEFIACFSFGEEGMLEKKRWNASVTFSEDSMVYALGVEEFKSVLNGYPEAFQKIKKLQKAATVAHRARLGAFYSEAKKIERWLVEVDMTVEKKPRLEAPTANSLLKSQVKVLGFAASLKNTTEASATAANKIVPVTKEKESVQSGEATPTESWQDPVFDFKQPEDLAELLLVDHDGTPTYTKYTSLGFLTPEHPIRKLCIAVVLSSYFEGFILSLIVLSSITLSMDSPTLDEDSVLKKLLGHLDKTFNIIFLMELILKVMTYGWIMHPGSYLWDSWNVLDLFIVTASLPDLILGEGSLSALSSVRLLRALRPLRTISRIKGMQVVVEAILKSIPTVIIVMLFGLFEYFVFAILGVQLFSGQFYRCSDPSISREEDCINLWKPDPEGTVFVERLWQNPVYNFDSLPNAMLSLTVISTCNKWSEIMWNGMDINGIGKQPIEDNASYMAMYFVLFLVLSAFMWVNLLVSVVVDFYSQASDAAQAKKAVKSMEEMEKSENENPADTQDTTEDADVGSPVYFRKTFNLPLKGFRAQVFDFIMHPRGDLVINVCIVLNTCVMITVHEGQTDDWTLFQETCNLIFTIIYDIEAILKLIALYPRAYFSDNWNIFDFVIAFVATLTEVSGALGVQLIDMSFIRIMRLGRLCKLVKTARGLNALMNTLLKSLPTIGNVACLLFLLFFVFAVLGMNLFGHLQPTEDGGYLNHNYNYRTVGETLLTLVAVFTGSAIYDQLAATYKNECDLPKMCLDVGVNSTVYPSALQTCSEFWTAVDEDQDLFERISKPGDVDCTFNPTSPMFFVLFFTATSYFVINILTAALLSEFGDNAAEEGIIGSDMLYETLYKKMIMEKFCRQLTSKVQAFAKQKKASQATLAMNADSKANSTS
ncbi:mitochondrial thiamine pyrophosphate transporter [Cymbomonas tetramitiformis]|uniref:Mitochondrial thiamine pyrophosphate transporter n=1 Tax=Cymbomonas tetramitiformis TaxID=36881 RepID=A0AAE0BS45_9CHLO|nr:mitochondrial thiamine pyrophosphate transporter [Cymbomonas tetramitiformis]|eukprot:gene6651-7964_t